MNEIKIKKFLDKKFKETSEKENFCYEEISLIYKIKINNLENEVKTQKIFSLKTKKVVEKNCIVNGKFQGIREIFDKNGYIILRGAYLDGKKVGLWHEYENNKIKIRVAFDEEEKFSGLYKEYYQDGSLKEECIYIKGNLIKIEIKGLQGGHSGMDIHKGFGNANVLLGRLLYNSLESQEIELISIDGGGLRNAIPREATAVFSVKNTDEFIAEANELKTEILQEFASIEKDLVINIEKTESSENGLSKENSTQIIRVLKSAHNGVYRMSPDVADLVEASNNIARVELKDGSLKILNLTRSSVESSKFNVANQLKAVFELGGLNVEFSGSYPGWKPNPNSEILRIMEKLYTDKFGSKPNVVACHAGLECGIIGANYPKMEMVSFGPTIKGAHSPDERASISSTQKFWDFLKEILKNIPNK